MQLLICKICNQEKSESLMKTKKTCKACSNEKASVRRARLLFEREELSGSLFQEKKICNICNQIKLESEFSPYNFSRCKACLAIKKNLEILKNFPKEMWNQAKKRAKKANLEFTIIPEDIIIPEYCPVFGTKLVIRKLKGSDFSKNTNNSPSLDRVNPHKGYTPENTRVISNRANTIKNNANPEELLLIALYIIKNKD